MILTRVTSFHRRNACVDENVERAHWCVARDDGDTSGFVLPVLDMESNNAQDNVEKHKHYDNNETGQQKSRHDLSSRAISIYNNKTGLSRGI